MILSKPLRYRLEHIGFRAAQAAATSLPLEAVSLSSGVAWRLIAPRLHRQERALRNLALAYPELSDAERKRIAAGMWENLGRTFGESFHLKEIIAQKRIRFEPQEQLEEIVRGGPCVVCGLHLGNWELVAYASKLMGASFTGVYQRLNNPLVDEETRKLRAFLYEGGLLPKTPVSARALMKTAKSGGYPAFLADHRDLHWYGRSVFRRSRAFDRFSRSACSQGRAPALCRRRLPRAEGALRDPSPASGRPAHR
jgi:Kdo2-lipid IVA lauroyltransferase/acyltransferase